MNFYVHFHKREIKKRLSFKCLLCVWFAFRIIIYIRSVCARTNTIAFTHTVIYLICRCVECTINVPKFVILYTYIYAFLCNSSHLQGKGLIILYDHIGTNTIYMYLMIHHRACIITCSVLCGRLNYTRAALARIYLPPTMQESGTVEILPPDVTTFGWLGVIFHFIKNSQSPWLKCYAKFALLRWWCGFCRLCII